MERERQLAARDGRMPRQPEQLLHANVESGRARRLVVDGVTIARGRLEMRGRLFLQALLQVPRQQRIEGRAQGLGADFG